MEARPEEQVCMKPFCIAVQSAAVRHPCLPPTLHPRGQKAEMLMNHVCAGNLLLGFLPKPPFGSSQCLLARRWDSWDLPRCFSLLLVTSTGRTISAWAFAAAEGSLDIHQV